jgi:primase-polymerase (primpol)-like protein
MKQNDSDVKHSKETDSNINVIQSDDSDHDIPVTKDESDIEKNVTTAVTVAADDSDIEENVNTQVTVAADDSDSLNHHSESHLCLNLFLLNVLHLNHSASS